MNNKKSKIKRYDLGYFVDKHTNSISGGLQTAGSIIGGLNSNPNQENAAATIGSSALSMGATGLQAGGLIGGAIGLGVGAIGGIISSGKKERALEQRRKRIANNSLGNDQASMTEVNVDPYGTQMYADGDLVSEGDKPIRTKYSGKDKFVQKAVNASYDASLLVNGAFHVSPNGTPTPWGKDPSIKDNIQPKAPIQLSDKARGLDNTYNPSRNIPQGPSVATIHKSSNFYADGDEVQDNIINIEKNELLIDPKTGKILQEYNGINPLTGGLFEPHAKGKKKESDNNLTIADPGTFVITKKRSKQYKDAIENNDSIAKETVLMNIRNNKLDKQGGLKPKNYAYGDYVEDELPLGIRKNTPAYAPQGIMSNSSYEAMLGLPQGLASANPNFAVGISTQPKNGFNTDLSSKMNPTYVKETSSGENGFDKVMNYAPAITNLAQGLFGTPASTPYIQKATNPYLNRILGNMPKNVNMQPIVNDIYNNQSLANQDIKNNVNSSAVYRANRQRLGASTAKQLEQARLQEQQINNGVASQRANILGNLGQEDVQQQNLVTRTNLGIEQQNNNAKAAQQNILNTGISQLQQIGQNSKYNKQKQNMDKYSLDLMAQIFPNLKYYDQFNAEDLIKKLR